jgi:hypothetical protein
MEISQAKSEIKELEEKLFLLLLEFSKRTQVRVTNISIREEFFVAKEPMITGVKIYTTIDS